MLSSPRSALSFLAALILGALPVSPVARAQQPSAPEATPPLSVAECIQRVVASDEQRREHRQAMECDETVKTERLDDQDKVVSTKTIYFLGGETKDLSYSTKVESRSAPTPSPDGKLGKDEEAVKAQSLVAVMNLRHLSPRYTFALAGSAQIHGRDCNIFTYHPKPGQPAATREEKVVNNLQGHYWIDKNTFEILQVDGSLASPVSVALIASVTRMDFKFHSQTLPNGEAGPLDFSVNLAVRAPFYDFRQRQTTTMENWRPRKK